jgi:acyl-CoA reductase-like NAD-dependent aldehyde dehydrogenase
MERLEVLKTYKIYIGGQFPRTESGRFYSPENKKGMKLANVCLSSRKDLRNAVSAARKAFGGWSERAAFNRGQILYRIAEMLESRKAQFVEELLLQGSTEKEAKQEIQLCIDRLVYYSGWCDKYQQIYSSVNPVASSHFNFSVLEATGVVGIIAPEENSLIGLISVLAPVIAGGNTAVVLASESKPLCAVTFAEVLHSSDVPSGVVNILTGSEKELAAHFASHMDINAVAYCRNSTETFTKIQELSVDSVKRSCQLTENWMDEKAEKPTYIQQFQEVKTTWHPIENVGGATASY